MRAIVDALFRVTFFWSDRNCKPALSWDYGGSGQAQKVFAILLSPPLVQGFWGGKKDPSSP